MVVDDDFGDAQRHDGGGGDDLAVQVHFLDREFAGQPLGLLGEEFRGRAELLDQLLAGKRREGRDLLGAGLGGGIERLCIPGGGPVDELDQGAAVGSEVRDDIGPAPAPAQRGGGHFVVGQGLDGGQHHGGFTAEAGEVRVHAGGVDHVATLPTGRPLLASESDP